jgi:class 3 adenylate cyclase/YHS domain-containing protein
MRETAEHTFLFADLSGFTALTEAHGDEDAADLVGAFIASVRTLSREHGAELVKSIGDAAMIRCEHADDAIRLGVRIVTDVGGRHGFPIVRVGMHTGPATERDGDWFGATVNLAARISGIAGGDEVLLSAATREQAGHVDGISLGERGRHPLRNVAEPVLLFEAHPQGARSREGLPIDPVCRMAVDPDDAAGTLRHDGVRYYFCSLDCAHRFAKHPDRYTTRAADDTGGDV